MADAVDTAVAAEIPAAPSKGRGRLIVVVAAALALLTGLGRAGGGARRRGGARHALAWLARREHEGRSAAVPARLREPGLAEREQAEGDRGIETAAPRSVHRGPVEHRGGDAALGQGT